MIKVNLPRLLMTSTLINAKVHRPKVHNVTEPLRSCSFSKHDDEYASHCTLKISDDERNYFFELDRRAMAELAGYLTDVLSREPESKRT